MPTTPPLPSRLTQQLLGPLTLLAAAIAMIAWTWDLHVEPIVDFGREVYVAWRLSAGEVLYRDIDYFSGPLSPYFNGLIFKMFGPQLLALQIANLGIWAGMIALLYGLCVWMSDRLSAFLALLMVITLMSFVQFNGFPIFNFVGPYAHEITHSSLCAAGAFACLWAYLNSRKLLWIGAAGALSGLVFLMKVEVTVALAGAIGVALLHRWERDSISAAGIAVASAAMTVVTAWLLLMIHLAPGEAFRGVLGSWRFIGDARLTNNPFYRGLFGISHLGMSLKVTAIITGMVLLALGPAGVLAFVIKRRGSSANRIWTATGIAVGFTVLLLCYVYQSLLWTAALLPMGEVLVGLMIGFAITAFCRRRTAHTPRFILQASFCVYALGMLSKMFFSASMYHYGFALCLPTVLVGVMLLAGWIPAWIARHGGTAMILQLAVSALLVVTIVRYLTIYNDQFRSQNTVTIDAGGEHFRMDIRGVGINKMLRAINQRLQPADTLACIPDGGLINVLTRHRNPTGELVLIPGEFLMYGDAEITRRFTDHPPDDIIMMKRDTTPFGYKGFGIDYGQALSAWIHSNYVDITPSDATDGRYPMRLLVRKR